MISEATIKITGVYMDKPFKEVLEFIKSKGLNYEVLK